MTGCCPFCGAEYALTEARCWECKVALPENPTPTLAVDETGESGEEVLYELDDWPVASRVELTATLATRGIPSRWEPGLTLAVRASDDEVAEFALDELEESATVDEDDDETDEDGDGDDEDGGAVAQAAMADLFVAADRLMHEPDDEVVAAELGLAADIVGESPPPFGIESQLWGQVRELSTVVCGHIDAKAAPEVVSADARTLREALRPYV
ncbi:MAG TPA: hypothetical protein VHS52_06800 [Acidimicrobiales bacterium]|jgi:hypothetical protein|nr:hypothetical protein [Acidimicrobiales bacterium]